MLVYLKRGRFQTFGFEADMKLCIEQFGCWPGFFNGKPLRLGWVRVWSCFGWFPTQKKTHPKKNISGLFETNPLKAAGILDIFWLMVMAKNDHYSDQQICTWKALKATGLLACELTHFAAPFWDPSESLVLEFLFNLDILILLQTSGGIWMSRVCFPFLIRKKWKAKQRLLWRTRRPGGHSPSSW